MGVRNGKLWVSGDVLEWIQEALDAVGAGVASLDPAGTRCGARIQGGLRRRFVGALGERSLVQVAAAPQPYLYSLVDRSTHAVRDLHEASQDVAAVARRAWLGSIGHSVYGDRLRGRARSVSPPW